MSAEPSGESSAGLSDPAENGQVSASENVRVLYRLRNRNITASSPSAVLSGELIADSRLNQGGASGPRSSASAAAMESGQQNSSSPIFPLAEKDNPPGPPPQTVPQIYPVTEPPSSPLPVSPSASDSGIRTGFLGFGSALTVLSVPSHSVSFPVSQQGALSDSAGPRVLIAPLVATVPNLSSLSVPQPFPSTPSSDSSPIDRQISQRLAVPLSCPLPVPHPSASRELFSIPESISVSASDARPGQHVSSAAHDLLSGSPPSQSNAPFLSATVPVFSSVSSVSVAPLSISIPSHQPAATNAGHAVSHVLSGSQPSFSQSSPSVPTVSHTQTALESDDSPAADRDRLVLPPYFPPSTSSSAMPSLSPFISSSPSDVPVPLSHHSPPSLPSGTLSIPNTSVGPTVSNTVSGVVVTSPTSQPFPQSHLHSSIPSASSTLPSRDANPQPTHSPSLTNHPALSSHPPFLLHQSLSTAHHDASACAGKHSMSSSPPAMGPPGFCMNDSTLFHHSSASVSPAGSPSPDSGPQGPQHFALSSAAGSASSVSTAQFGERERERGENESRGAECQRMDSSPSRSCTRTRTEIDFNSVCSF